MLSYSKLLGSFTVLYFLTQYFMWEQNNNFRNEMSLTSHEYLWVEQENIFKFTRSIGTVASVCRRCCCQFSFDFDK